MHTMHSSYLRALFAACFIRLAQDGYLFSAVVAVIVLILIKQQCDNGACLLLLEAVKWRIQAAVFNLFYASVCPVSFLLCLANQ